MAVILNNDASLTSPSEQRANAREQAGKAGTYDWTGDRRNSLHGNVVEIDTRVESTLGVDELQQR